jgi:hypothetical protein
VLDKVEVRVSGHAMPQPELQYFIRQLPYAGFDGAIRKARHYTGIIDARMALGIDAMVHFHYRRNKPKDHKIEIIESGHKTVGDLRGIIKSLFDIDPDECPLMRVDFAADMPGLPIQYAQSSLRVRYKRSSDERGEMDYETIGGRILEYFRYGKSPNCIRAYDKDRECQTRYPEFLKRASRDAEPPTFEECFGFPRGSIMTRIERQAGGGRLPIELRKFSDLQNAAEYDPFSSIEIVPSVFPIPDVRKCGEAELVKILGVHTLVQRLGLQNARAMLNINGNAARTLRPYYEFQRDIEDASFSREDIVQSYRQSTLRQTGEANSKLLTSANPLSIIDGYDRHAGQPAGVFPGTGENRSQKTSEDAHA